MTQSNDFLEVLSPAFIGSKLFTLALSDQTPNPAALQEVRIDIDYSLADDYGGVVLPIAVLVQSPSPRDFIRRIFTRAAPDSFVFSPRESGPHLIVVREIFHNQLHGALTLEVAGERS